MKKLNQRISFLTLGVDDLEKVKNFYIEKLGWTPMREEGIVFFKMNGFILSLYPNHELAEDANVQHDGQGFKRFTMAINVGSEQEVDAVFADLKQKGVNIVQPPAKVFWGGYRGYFEDIEHNLWEIAYNPFIEMDAEGNILS